MWILHVYVRLLSLLKGNPDPTNTNGDAHGHWQGFQGNIMGLYKLGICSQQYDIIGATVRTMFVQIQIGQPPLR